MIDTNLPYMKQKVNTISRLLQIGYLIVVVGLFLYSFTQVDLSLTLSEWSIWQIVQKFFQNIGYFQRPLSTLFYIVIILLLYIFYFAFLFLAHKKKITRKEVWFLILATTVILTFSYNAFSYDLFNYIFDAKIVTHYHQNPYIHKALDFPQDPMLSFMHWTHRTYPYGPMWLILTVPLSFFVNFFLPTFFIFKTLIALSFLGTAFFISKILNKISPHNEVFGLVFFALNPLVIIESLVSGHNDIVMIFLSMVALYSVMNNKYVRSFILLVLSIGIKFATIFLIPVFAFLYFQIVHRHSGNSERSVEASRIPIENKRFWTSQNDAWQKIFLSITALMIIPVAMASVRTDFQPWYLLYVLPFSALISKKYYVFIPSVVVSFFALLQYAPFLYLGNWNEPVPTLLLWITISSILLSLVLILFWQVRSFLVIKKQK